MTSVYRLILNGLLTRGRVIALGLLAVIPIVLGVALRSVESGVFNAVYKGVVEGYVLGLLVPVVSLVFASAAFGDLVDDRTLVYLWLKPIPRWQITLAALAATLTVALPLTIVPAVVAVSASGAGVQLVRGAAAGTGVAVIAYSCLFLGLGLRVRRALVWGLAYVLIWEGAVARAARGAARLSINVHARSLVARIGQHALPPNASSAVTAVVVPLVVAVVAVNLTAWWLARADVD